MSTNTVIPDNLLDLGGLSSYFLPKNVGPELNNKKRNSEVFLISSIHINILLICSIRNTDES